MLNSQQKTVVDHRHGPALVIAGAGTGKTRVLVERTVRLLKDGVKPRELLIITFTRKAALELRERITSACSQDLALPWCGTFHGVAVRMLRQYGAMIGLPSSFSILDESDAGELLWSIVTRDFTAEQRKQLPKKSSLPGIHSYAVNTGRDLTDVLAERWPTYLPLADKLAALFEDFQTSKVQCNAYNYDDLLSLWLKLLRQCPSAAALPAFEQIMVDEYQDTNHLQAQILYELGKQSRNLMVVGDDAQAIYAFRGATVDNILHFENHFADCRRLQLEKNYRSSQDILDLSNALLAEAKEGFGKKLSSDRGVGSLPFLSSPLNEWEQAEHIVGEIARQWTEQGLSLRQQAVLFRSSFHTFKLETLLNRHHIPFRKYGGIRFADSAHIKDVLAFLRCRENPSDETAWHRVLELFPGIGPSAAGRFCSQLRQQVNPVKVFTDKSFPKRSLDWQQPFLDVIQALFAPEPLPLDLQLKTICQLYAKLLPDLHDDNEKRLAGLRTLEELCGKYSSRRELLDDLSVGDDSILGNVDPRAEGEFLTLSTIHSAKGCEWDCVHVMQLTEGGLPSANSLDCERHIEEERRLLYVAMTRARDWLFLYSPLSREVFSEGGRTNQPCRPSRFLTPVVLECCDTPFSAEEANEAEYHEACVSFPGPDQAECCTPFDDTKKPFNPAGLNGQIQTEDVDTAEDSEELTYDYDDLW
jgi:DNA helicase-2/ATP-dependent DNA helicase PcrA